MEQGVKPHVTNEAHSGPSDSSVVARIDKPEKTTLMLKEAHNTSTEARSGPSDPSVMAGLDKLEKAVCKLNEAAFFSQPSSKVVHADVSYKFLKSLEAKCPIHENVLSYCVR